MKKILLALLALLLLVIAVMVIRTLGFSSQQLKVDAIPPIEIHPDAADHFAEAISIRTVSFGDPADFDSIQFDLFNKFLSDTYPLVHSQLEHQVFHGYTHLYSWMGKDPTLDPVILMSHHDVVPIASFYKWSVHPFTEGIKGDTIYGRGAIDDKFGVIGLLEATEQLLQEGHTPRRSIYLSFGHDEEVLGNGAVAVVDYLKNKGVRAALVLDEGQAITQDLVPGVTEKIALIGIAEKGYQTLELQVDMAGGHSSTPAAESSIDVLASAIGRLKANQFDAKITPALKGFMEAIGPHMSFISRFAFANADILEGMILKSYHDAGGAASSSVRTTIAPTIFEAGIKDNVIPTTARASVNFRILPGETKETVLEHVIHAIDDERVQVNFASGGSAPSPVSPIKSEAYDLIQKSIKQVYPDVLIGPSLVVGGTDSRHFTAISDYVYRFAPFHITPHNYRCFHGIDERVVVNEFEDGIRFYRQMILNGSDM